MFFLYQLILTLLIFTIAPLIFFYRIFKNKEDKKRFIEKLSLSTIKRKKGKLIWFHGASVGELLSIIPLIRHYEKDKSIQQILVTSSTLSSSKVLKKFSFKKTIHQFYPIDHLYFVNKFITYWKPNISIFIESELWPTMFKKIYKENIPLILLNARITKKTFQRWKKINLFSKNIFNKVSVSYPQNLETKKYLKKLNFLKIKFLGNLKFAEDNENFDKKYDYLKFKFKNKRIWVASSTHKNEEIFCAKAHLELKKKFKNLLTIIIPRHVHRANEIKREINNLNLNIVTHSSKRKSLDNIDIYLVDTFGETQIFHDIGSSVFLGGSIIKRGGQNPLEAARYGSKIFHGPNIDNFIDVYKLLNKFKISRKVKTPKELASLLIFKKNKNQGIKIRNIGKKILNKTIKELDYLIKNDFKKT